MSVVLSVILLLHSKMKYNFSLEKRKKNGKLVENNVPIRISVTHNSQRIFLNPGFRVDMKSWDENAEIVKKGFYNKKKIPYNIINARLAEQKKFLDTVMLNHQLTGEVISLEKLKEDFNNKFSAKKAAANVPKEEKKPPSFYELYDTFVAERGRLNDWTKATHTKFSSLKKHLLRFDDKLDLKKLDEKKLTDLVAYFRQVADMKNSTIKKQLGFVKWFLNWTVDKEYPTNKAFKSFNPKLKEAQKQVIYLTQEELNKVRGLEIPDSKQYLERVRDVFLFCCYTSLRYSDVYALRKCDINDGKLSIITKKTHERLTFKLNDKALKILEQYEEIPLKQGKALPVISNQRMNDYLKELCELAEIDTPITLVDFIGNVRNENTYPKYSLMGTHTGRRTFICNALKNGMPPHAVMKITGHSDYKAMKPYIDIVSKDIDNMVEQYINF